ncbi:hypothetical protein DVH05_027376 [Phytophthora capsici]|nr:hypothetical protein DVH05_027376 [Phytophthora capsici]
MTKHVQLGRRGPRVTSVESIVPTQGESIGLNFNKKKKKHVWRWQIFNLIRRLGAVTSACVYVYASMTATWWALQVLSGARNPTETLRVFTSSLIKGYVGDGLIADSPLVLNVLSGDTTPRDYAVYLESATKTSIVGCTDVPLVVAGATACTSC